MSYSVNGFKPLRMVGGVLDSIAPTFYDIPASRTSNAIVCPGRWAVESAVGSNTLDVARGANDTANGGSGARLIKGLIAEVYDTTGRMLDNQAVPNGTACKVRLYQNTSAREFIALEDGVGNVISYPTNTSVAMADSVPTSTTSTETLVPVPEAHDLLDSSTHHATSTQHAFFIRGKHGDVRGIDNTNQVYCVSVNAGYLSATAA
jgi:hypothetical protein